MGSLRAGTRPVTWIDANGFLSFLLNVAGNLFLAWKWRSGWVVRIVAILSWGLYGVQIRSNPIILNAVTFFCINCYGWWKWRKEERAAQWFEDQRRAA
jgi:hypothetical protein